MISTLNLLVAGALSLSAETFSKRGKLLFSDDFSGAVPATAWVGKVGTWEVVDGVAKMSERAEDKHGAVRRHPGKYRNATIEFKFRFDGASQIVLMVNEPGAHVGLVYITPTQTYLQTGKRAGNVGEAVKLASTDQTVAPGKWHRAVVEFRGRVVTAQIDGQQTIQGENERLDVDKNDLAFMVVGVSGLLDDVKVFEIAAK
jgi:hypothetical protein